MFRCADCGVDTPKWMGRCPACGEWNTLAEEVEVAAANHDAAGPVTSMPDIDAGQWAPRSTGVGELDRVLGGGLVPGSVTLLGGEPGVGKSTLLLQMAAAMADAGVEVLYVSAEESPQQVRLRAERLGAVHPALWVASETALPHVLDHIGRLSPAVVVIDSIQALADPDLGSAAGSVGQVRSCAAGLVVESKARGLATVLVGHVTKDGALAGPRVLEHAVDTVLMIEGERHHTLRLLRARKHRFGSTNELGVLEMTETGLVGVPDPSGLLLDDRCGGLPGSVVSPAMVGDRPVLVEIQALVAPSALSPPRRSAQGLDPGRLGMVLAVLERRTSLSLASVDVYGAAVGGVKVGEPAADLPAALSVASSRAGIAVAEDIVAFGEVGLAGEMRRVAGVDRRLEEAARLGFGRAVLPKSACPAGAPIELLGVATLSEAITLLGLDAA